MKFRLSTAALGAALVFAATVPVGAQGTGGSSGHMSKQGSVMMARSSSMTVPMKAQNGSAENGSATVRDTPQGLVVTINIKHAKGPQPVHIHKGMCAKLDPKPEQALHNVVIGMSATTVPGLTLAKLRATPHAINVHKSATDIPTYVSCGDIK